jgi:G3E family GTPase
VLVLDADALSRGLPLPDSQQQTMADAGLLLMNKSESLDEAARVALSGRLPRRPLLWTSQGRLPIARLPGIAVRASEQSQAVALPTGAASLPQVWLDPSKAICQVQATPENWSIGWRWHPSQRFDLDKIAQWLAQWPWRRAKLVVHGGNGWQSANALDGDTLVFSPSEWRRDSRIELIFAEPQPQAELERAMDGCRIRA